METARVLTDGRNQTVSIPQAYRFDVDEVYVNKIGEALILTPVSELAAAFDRGAAMLTDDFLADGVPKSVPERLALQDELAGIAAPGPKTRTDSPHWTKSKKTRLGDKLVAAG